MKICRLAAGNHMKNLSGSESSAGSDGRLWTNCGGKRWPCHIPCAPSMQASADNDSRSPRARLDKAHGARYQRLVDMRDGRVNRDGDTAAPASPDCRCSESNLEVRHCMHLPTAPRTRSTEHAVKKDVASATEGTGRIQARSMSSAALSASGQHVKRVVTYTDAIIRPRCNQIETLTLSGHQLPKLWDRIG